MGKVKVSMRFISSICSLYLIMSKYCQNTQSLSQNTFSPRLHSNSNHIINTHTFTCEFDVNFKANLQYVEVSGKKHTQFCRGDELSWARFYTQLVSVGVLFCSTSTRELCDDTHTPRWLSAFPRCSQTFKPTPAIEFYAYMYIQPSITFNKLENFYSVKLCPATQKCYLSTTKDLMSRQKDMPFC